MAETRFHSLLRAKVEELAKERGHSIVSGVCVDLAHYKQEVGFIKGLLAALELADEIEMENE